MKKHIISILILFLLLSASFVGVSNQEKQETVDIDKSELRIDGDPNFNILHSNETPGIQWCMQYGAVDWPDNIEKVRQTSDGGYILIGDTRSYSPDHYTDAWLVKTDSRGVEEWNRSYGVHGSFNNDLGRSVEQTFDGGYIFSGLRNSCFWLVKTDAQGEMQWENTYEAGRVDCVIQVSDGGYIMTGSSGMGMGIDLIRTDSEGTVLWSKIFFPSNYSGGDSVQETSDGGFILAGDTTYYSNYPDHTKSVLLKTDQDGNEQWNKTYWMSADVSRFFSVQQTPDHGYIVSGTINGTPWLVRTDENGSELWNRTFTDLYKGSLEVDQTIDGGFILVAADSSLHYQSCVFKIDADGTIIWELPIESTTGPIATNLRSIQQTTDGGYIAAGSHYPDTNGFLIKIGHVPHVEIMKPTNGVYLFNKKILDFPRPLIIGRITIEATASDTMYTIEQVEFSIDDSIQSTDTTAPYNWQWTTWSFFKHTITATAYNAVGNCSSETINVLKIF
jgi:hypothetical protein